MLRPLLALLLFAGVTTPAAADDAPSAYGVLARAAVPDGMLRFDVGVTTAGVRMPALIDREEVSPVGERFRITVVATDPDEARAAVAGLKWFRESDEAERWRSRVVLTVVAGPNNAAYPPTGTAYAGEQREAHSLWRWLGLHAPDLVVDLRSDLEGDASVRVPPGSSRTHLKLGPEHAFDGDLTSALVQSPAAGIGTIPAAVVRLDEKFPAGLLERIDRAGITGPSPARRELQRRVERTPLATATSLSEHYGHELGSVSYIPALALVGRLRLWDLTNDPTHAADVRRIVEPYRSGTKPSFGDRPNGANVAGHLVFAELADRTGDEAYTKLVEAVLASACEPDAKGTPFRPHSEMSDAVFMGGPLLARAANLANDPSYRQLCLRHERFMTTLNLREDGLHRHSPLDETAWGRGNGFPALGLAMVLDTLPADNPDRDEVLRMHRAHLEALRPHQDATGMWHQVVDHPGSYREMSCTCMTTYAILRGLRTGRLDRETYEPVVRRSWPAIAMRIGDDGALVDVCTGTGKQKSLQAYLDRTAILGRDARGGAMALLVSTEMAAWEREHPESDLEGDDVGRERGNK